MDLDKILDHWAKDAKIDDINLDNESGNIPVLHSKYLKFMAKERSKLNLLLQKRAELNRLLTDYYRGEANNPEDLKMLNREPWQKVTLKAEVADYIAADKATIKLNLMIAEQQEICKTLEEILRQINGRNFQIKNMIDWKRLTQFGDA